MPAKSGQKKAKLQSERGIASPGHKETEGIDRCRALLQKSVILVVPNAARTGSGCGPAVKIRECVFLVNQLPSLLFSGRIIDDAGRAVSEINRFPQP
jgi:hypothetical protein